MAEEEDKAEHTETQQGEQEDENIEKASSASDSFIDDGDEDNEAAAAGEEEEKDMLPEEPLTEQEIEELIAELLEVESKAAEAQEALEGESLAKVEADVRAELAQTLSADDLESAVAEEMKNFKLQWESELDELETESAQLLEQLDGAGIELPSLYKWIESQAPNSCCTEAWKRRTQWVGSQVTSDFSEAVVDAEKYLDIHRPVRRKHGKILEEGASGFLERKLAGNDGSEGLDTSVDWSSFNKMCSDKSSLDNVSFGSKQWASVYLASTPQQAAELGLKFPGVDEVEEIDDIEDDPVEALVVDDLSEEQKRKFRKVKEEDDVKIDKKLQRHLKQRHRNRQKLH